MYFHFNTHGGIRWQKLPCSSLSGKCQSYLSIIEWKKQYLCQWYYIIRLIVVSHHRWWQDANFNFFVGALIWSFIDTSWAAHLWVGNAKTIYPSLSGKNSACVSDIRSYGWLLKDTIDDDKMQILTRISHYLTFLFKHLYDHSLTQVGLPIFEWEMLKLFIHRWVEKIVLVSVILDHMVDC